MGEKPNVQRVLTKVKSDPTKAYCTVCKKPMTAVVTAIRKHQAKQLQIPSSSRIDSMLRQIQQGNDAVKETELRLAAFISEHNLSFKVMDHLSDLPKLCPASKIAANVKCKRTKTKCIITNSTKSLLHTCLNFDLISS